MKYIHQERGTEYAKYGHKITKITKNPSLLAIKCQCEDNTGHEAKDKEFKMESVTR